MWKYMSRFTVRGDLLRYSTILKIGEKKMKPHLYIFQTEHEHHDEQQLKQPQRRVSNVVV